MFVEQIVRPTGLVDPICEIRKASNQVEDIIEECKKVTNKKSEGFNNYTYKKKCRIGNRLS